MRALLALLLVPVGTTLANAQAPDCYCTGSRGERHELGAVACLTVDGRAFQARCEMHGNVPSWRRQPGGCPSA